MDLIEVLQQITQKGVEGMKPTDLAFGTVFSVSPMTVIIDGTMQAIPEAALVLTDGVRAKTYNGVDSAGDSFSVVINDGLVPGDKIVMLRCAAGQRYIILSRV
jgi:hypothetical protein